MMNQHESESQHQPQDAGPARSVKPRTLAIVAIIVVLGIVGAGIGVLVSGQDRSAATGKPVTPTDPQVRQHAYQLAETGISRNADWTPYVEVINGVEMALVPAGCFQMGSNDGPSDEQPMHKVCFDAPFWIDVYEVTNRLYGGADCTQWSSDKDQPRICGTWDDAQAHCASRGARLPTEAEWEYAARGPDGLIYPWGNDFIPDNVVYQGNADGQTWAVGSKPGGISWVGAYDLSGNVWEWVNDWYNSGYYGTLVDGAVNPQGPSSSGDRRVLRGGSWDYDLDSVRAALRYWETPVISSNDYGFRCALSYQP